MTDRIAAAFDVLEKKGRPPLCYLLTGLEFR